MFSQNMTKIFPRAVRSLSTNHLYISMEKSAHRAFNAGLMSTIDSAAAAQNKLATASTQRLLYSFNIKCKKSKEIGR